MRIVKVFTSLITITLLTGCATEVIQKYPILRSDAEKVTITDAVIVFEPNKIDVEVPRSHMADTMGGGALFALGDLMIESNRKSTARKDISPILEAIKASSLAQDVPADFSSRLKAISWLRLNDVRVVSTEENFDEDNLMRERPDHDLLLIHITNSFPTSKRSINTTGKTLLRLKSASINSSGNKRDAIILDKKFEVSHSIPNSYSYGADPVVFWSANSGETIVAGIRENSQFVADELIKSLNQPFIGVQ